MINVLAGINGAGKSSILGASFRANHSEYFNPDEITQSIMANDPDLSMAEANSAAWTLGFNALKDAIDGDDHYTFETTLGGNSIARQLRRAADQGRTVRIWFCGLASVEMHIERVAVRVAKGGHDIPEDTIRQRWQGAFANMVDLIPRVHMVQVFDNSAPLDQGKPAPKLLFHLENRTFIKMPGRRIPDWAKPLAAAAIKTVV